MSTRFRVAVIPCRSVSASFRVWKFRFIPFQVHSVSENSVSFRFASGTCPHLSVSFRFGPFPFHSPPFHFVSFRFVPCNWYSRHAPCRSGTGRVSACCVLLIGVRVANPRVPCWEVRSVLQKLRSVLVLSGPCWGSPASCWIGPVRVFK